VLLLNIIPDFKHGCGPCAAAVVRAWAQLPEYHAELIPRSRSSVAARLACLLPMLHCLLVVAVVLGGGGWKPYLSLMLHTCCLFFVVVWTE
jgi:hypothetical protein